MNVIICNGCQSETNYSQLAISSGAGFTVIMNLESRQGRAYNVIPSQHNPSTFIAVTQPLPSYVMASINGYHDLKSAFAQHAASQSQPGYSTLGANILSSVPSYNGCGTPSSRWTYAMLPDFPFKDACDSHDICYTLNRSKASCDGEFLYDMKQIVINKVYTDGVHLWWTSPAGAVLFPMVMNAQAEAYYIGVVNLEAAKTAYCDSTTSPNPPECRTPPVGGGQGRYEGTASQQVTGISNGQTLTQTCELWSFADGLGGKYYMHRNCSFR